jgi:hypothetical protein
MGFAVNAHGQAGQAFCSLLAGCNGESVPVPLEQVANLARDLLDHLLAWPPACAAPQPREAAGSRAKRKKKGVVAVQHGQVSAQPSLTPVLCRERNPRQETPVLHCNPGRGRVMHSCRACMTKAYGWMVRLCIAAGAGQ